MRRHRGKGKPEDPLERNLVEDLSDFVRNHGERLIFHHVRADVKRVDALLTFEFTGSEGDVQLDFLRWRPEGHRFFGVELPALSTFLEVA